MGKQTEDAGFSGGQHQQTAANESPEKPSTPDTTTEMTDVDNQMLASYCHKPTPDTTTEMTNVDNQMLASYCHKPTPDTTIEMTDVNKQLLQRQSNGHNLATQKAASAAINQTLQQRGLRRRSKHGRA